jgi:hypothetical protein
LSESRDRFVRLAEARTRKTIKDIRLIGNLSNRSNYSYSEEDVRKVFRVLTEELKRAQRRFETAGGDADEVDFKLD